MDLTPQLLEKLRCLVVTNNKRNLRKANVGKTPRAKFSYDQLFGQYMKQCGICLYCENGLKIGTMTIEHVQPVGKGGKNTIENVILVCRECNQQRDYLYKNQIKNNTK